MIIEQPEAFKTWLTAVLKPMCDADPAALAKYVLALIKKDKSEQELQKIMVGQLEVFLEGETESFVSLVLRTLETQEYINTPVIPNANPPNPAAMTTKPKEVVVAVEKPPVVVVEAVTEQPSAVNGAGVARKEQEVKRDRELRKSDNEEKTTTRPTTRTRHRSSSRNRSRSRSWDRSKRSKSRERERDKRPRTWRNKSPPRRFDRRRSRTPSPAPLRGRSRSPKHQRPRYRNRTPPRGGVAGSPLGGGDRSRSRSRSPRSSKLSPDSRLGKDAAGGGHHSRPGTPTQDSNHGDMDLRLTNSTQSIQSVVQQQQQGAGGSSSSKRRCRDFDEKGYCMRGEMCPFDHGVDPVVLEDTQLSSVLSYNPNAGAPGDGVGVPPIAGAPLLNAPPGVGHPLMVGGPRAMGAEYNPQAPQMWNRPPGFRGPRPPMGMPRGPTMGGFPPPPNHQRELIPVPVMDSKQGGDGHGHGGHHGHHHHPYMVPGMGPGGHPGSFRPQYAQGGGGPMMGGGMGDPHDPNNPFKKKQFDFNRLGPRSKNPMNCSLELKKVPTGLNSITHLNNHFSKFGKTVNIQVNYEGDPEAALVTFSSHAEANAAYRSTEAVLNNRFIKVFWHNGNEGKQENVPPRSVKDRLGVPGIVAPNINKVLNLVQPKAEPIDNVVGGGEVNNGEEKGDKPAGQAATAPPIVTRNKEETKAQEAAAIKKGQELLAAKEKLKKNQEEQRKEVMKIKNDLRKKKQELLEKQLAQQKMLIEKMEKVPQGPQRDELMVTIKKTQESIESIKKDLQQSVLTVKPPPQKKAKEDVQREVLDAELDLITKQQEGADTSEIQKRLQELKAKVAMTRGGRGGIRGGGVGGGTRRFTPHGRHLLTKNNLIDNASGLKGNVKTVGGNNNKPTAAPFQKHTVDHRPTRLLVSGYETDEQESVLQHFQTFGEIVHFVTDLTLPSITLNYKTRKEAEMALLKGKHFQDRTLSITWCSIAPPLTPRSTPRKSLLSESEEDQLIDQSLQDGEEDILGPEISEEALLQDDEEEDEENEDRSWRR